MSLAQADIPNDIQGRSLVPLLKGQNPKGWRKSLYYHYYEFGTHNVHPHEGVRMGPHKLIRFYGKGLPTVKNSKQEEWELYDLDRDPLEMNNVIDHPDYTQILSKLKYELKTLRKELKVK